MVKNYKIYSLLIVLFAVLQSMVAQVTTIGNGTFQNSNFGGPAYTSTIQGAHSRYAYIFPSSVLGGLQHGDSIRSLAFLKNGMGSITGTCSMKIYIRNTVNTTYGSRNVIWNNQVNATRMRLFYDRNPANEIGSNPGWKRFSLDSAFVFDTAWGFNIELLVEYYQASSQNANVFWSYENANSVFGYSSNQTKFIRVNNFTMPDSTNSSSDVHPTIKFEYPRFDRDITVSKIYSLGKLPVPIGNPDTIKAIISNVGKKSNNTFKLYIISKGANRLIDSASYSLNLFEEKLVSLPLIYPQNIGRDTIEVRVVNDQNSSNNSLSLVRLATENIYSYRDVTQPIAGGIGFNGATGDFVAKFFSNSPKSINQISVNFAGSNQRFRLGIWDVDSLKGNPKNNLWTSDTLVSAPNFITPVLPSVKVNGSFFVGVRQIGLQNVAFGYQPDQPVRTQTFYYTSPSGDTNWVDFSPGAPFKFVIEPRLQALNDVAPIRYNFPRDTVDLTNVRTMAPKATIINFGSNNQTTPFATSLIIRRNNNIVYSSNIFDTLSSERRRVITFDSSFLPVSAGTYDVLLITRLANDQMKDNDTIRTSFVCATYNDVGLGSVFDPSSFMDYEQFIDTVYPTVFVQNFGLDTKGPFNVVAQIFDSLNNKLFEQSKLYTLGPLNSVLASFDAFPCSKYGTLYFRAFTRLSTDINRTNDTAKRVFKIIRSNDVAVTEAIYPTQFQVLVPPVANLNPQLKIENKGDANQDIPFKVQGEIWYGDSLIFKDSSTTNSYRNISSFVFFKKFQPTQLGYYKMITYTQLENDQFRNNDTLITDFAVGLLDDVEVVEVTPTLNSSVQIGKTIAPKVKLKNNGLLDQNTPFSLNMRVRLNNSLVYSSTKMVTIDSAQTKVITMDSTMLLSEPQNYDVEVWIQLSKDFDTSNNQLVGKYIAIKDFDIAVTEILNPKISDILLVGISSPKPLVRVEDKGEKLSKDLFTLTFKMFNASNNNLLYSKDMDTSFTSTSILDIEFPEIPVQFNVMAVRFETILFYNKDQYAQNNALVTNSSYRLLNDVKVNSIVLPENNRTYRLSSANVLPRIEVENEIADTSFPVKAVLTIQFIDTVQNKLETVYSDSLSIPFLLSNEIRTLNLNNSFSFASQKLGRYQAVLISQSTLDQISTNNVVSTNFRIAESVGLNSLQLNEVSINPNPANIEFIVSLSSSQFENENITIYNCFGQVVYEQVINGNQIRVSTQHLSSGIYYVKIGNEYNKLIVSH